MTLQEAIDEVIADRDKFDHPTGVTVISHQAAAVLVNAARAQLDLREQLAAMTQRAESAAGNYRTMQMRLGGLTEERDTWRVRAEQAEAALADTVITWLQCSNNIVRAKEQTLAASREVLAAEQANTTALQDLSVRLESVLSRVTAGQRFAQPQEAQP